MYLEKIIPISVKCRRNGDFILHIANFESGLDRAPVFGPIKLFNSLNVFKKTISRRKSGETAVLQDIKRRLNYKMYNYDAAESEENINIYISIVLNLLLYGKDNGEEIYKNLKFKSYFKSQILNQRISYRNNDNKNKTHKIIRLCITFGSQSKTKGFHA